MYRDINTCYWHQRFPYCNPRLLLRRRHGNTIFGAPLAVVLTVKGHAARSSRVGQLVEQDWITRDERPAVTAL